MARRFASTVALVMSRPLRDTGGDIRGPHRRSVAGGPSSLLTTGDSVFRPPSEGRTRRPDNAKLGHPAVEGIGLHAKQFRSAARAAHAPADAVHHPPDLLRLEVGKPGARSLRAGR